MTFIQFLKNNKYVLRIYIRRAIIIASVWIFFDYSSFSVLSISEDIADYPFADGTTAVNILRLSIAFIGYFLMAYYLVFPLNVKLRKMPLWLSFVLKSLILSVLIWVLATFMFFVIYFFAKEHSLEQCFAEYQHYVFDKSWMLTFILLRFLMFVATLFGLEIADKYSPGVFMQIFFGKYNKPREENRIIIFIDLINSTPIAESLGHRKYFHFIRDFIHHISTALLEYNGLIYQYVGDEIVVSWILNNDNKKKSIASLKRAQQIILQEAACYMKEYGVNPEFRAGIHCGTVTVGEIGIVKKDLAISGDAMNTTARIRSLTGKLDVTFLASSDFVNAVGMKTEDVRSVGELELKGKAKPMELFELLS